MTPTSPQSWPHVSVRNGSEKDAHHKFLVLKETLLSVWGSVDQICKLNHKMDGDYLNNGRLPASRDILQIVLHLFANYGGPPVGVREDGAPHHPTQLLGANPSPQITTPYNPWQTTSSIQQPPHTTPGWATTQPQLHHCK